MSNNQKDFDIFASEYQNEEKEVLILTRDGGESAGLLGQECGIPDSGDSWIAFKPFLAYVDIASNTLRKGEGRVRWLISGEDMTKHRWTWPHFFEDGVIYRLKVRELIDKTVPEGRLPSYGNRLMVVEVLEKNVHNDELLAILAEYRKPVIITDETLGEFILNKNLGYFDGKINWLKKDILVMLEVNPDSKSSWTKAMNVLRTLFEQQTQKDSEFRTFAAEQLTALANDWREEEDAEISKHDFINRISLSTLAVFSNGDFEADYDDDFMFGGHEIVVSGNIKKGLKSADIVG